jgi:hypothetical protein
MTTETVTKEDIEAKLREIQTVVDESTAAWTKWVIGGIAVAAVVMIGIGIMRSKRRPPVTVEIYHTS